MIGHVLLSHGVNPKQQAAQDANQIYSYRRFAITRVHLSRHSFSESRCSNRACKVEPTCLLVIPSEIEESLDDFFDSALSDRLLSEFKRQIDLQNRIMRTWTKLILITVLFPLATTSKLNSSPEADAKAVAALDTKYQAAAKANDTTTMDQILADDFALVTARGSTFSKADLIDSARKKEVTYERHDEEPGAQKIRMGCDTAVVTAFLWITFGPRRKTS